MKINGHDKNQHAVSEDKIISRSQAQEMLSRLGFAYVQEGHKHPSLDGKCVVYKKGITYRMYRVA